MQVWIAGGTGLIGRALSRALIAAGHSVAVFSRHAGTPMQGVSFYQWDPLSGTPLPELPAANAVISLAGEPVAQRWTPEVKKRIRDSRVTGTRNLIQALARLPHRPEYIISASATGFYGDRGEEVLNEASTRGAGFLADVCAEWEDAAQAATSMGMRLAVLRIGVVLAAEGGALTQMIPSFRAGVGGKIGHGMQWMSWIALADLVALFQFLLATQAAGIFNATSPEPVRNRDFTLALGHALHRPTFLTIPSLALRAIFGEMSQVLAASQRVMPQAAGDFVFRYPGIEAAFEAILHP